jgi:hypothetical protein
MTSPTMSRSSPSVTGGGVVAPADRVITPPSPGGPGTPVPARSGRARRRCPG